MRCCNHEDSFSFDFQNIRRLIRLPFFFSVLSGLSGGANSAIFSLLLLYELPTSLDRLARLDRLLDPGRTLVRAGIAAEREEERSADEAVVFAPLEKRIGWPLIMVEALLVRDGTSSTEPCPCSPVRDELSVALSVMEEVAVWIRGGS